MYLGIEIGGTKLQLAAGHNDGRLLAVRRWRVRPEAGGPGIQNQLAAGVPELLRDMQLEPSQVVRLGIGFGGPVDDRTRRVIKSHQIAGWDDFPLAKWAEQTFGIPTVIGNDADVAGLGEATWGAGRGLSPIFYVTIGSGIGGALILDGRIHRGTGVGAGEIGHLWIDTAVDAVDLRPDQPPWSILEHRSSGWAIQRAAGRADVPAVAAAAAAGSEADQRVLEAACRRLALALSYVVALICPRRIILGGGVALLGEERFLAPLRAELHQLAFPPFAAEYDVCAAALGEEVVLHGALALAAMAADGTGEFGRPPRTPVK